MTPLEFLQACFWAWLAVMCGGLGLLSLYLDQPERRHPKTETCSDLTCPVCERWRKNWRSE